MFTVHHLEGSRSHRIIWLLEELGVDYEIKRYKRDRKSGLAPAAMKKIHPLGKSPILTHGEKAIAESAVILEYILDHAPDHKLRPKPGTDDYLRYRYWLHAAEGSFMPLLVMQLIFKRTTEAPVPRLIRPITKQVAKQVGRSYINPGLKSLLTYVESELTEADWLSGSSFGAADIQMSYALEAVAVNSGLGSFANIKSYLEKLRKRPAYQASIEKSGPLFP